MNVEAVTTSASGVFHRRTRNGEQAIREAARRLILFRRTRHFASIVTLILTLQVIASAQSQPPTPSPSEAREEQQRQSAAESDNPRLGDQASPPNAQGGGDVLAAQPMNNAQQQQQQTAPDWITWVSGLSNIVIAIFTIVLALVAIFQIGYMRDALTETRRAADAAQNSVDVARESLVSVQRAFIRFKGIPNKRLTIRTNEGEKTSFTFMAEWENCGHTAAIPIINYFAIQQLPGEPAIDDFIGKMSPRNTTYIGPLASLRSAQKKQPHEAFFGTMATP
jgi:hypothetical protein